MILTAGSLFSGVGMMDYAFAQAGFDIRFQVEIDPYCRKVLEKHGPTYWPNAEVYADVRSVSVRELGYVDVLFGGFPCQDISKTGTRAGIRPGTRSGLWSEFARIVGEIRPYIVFVENVAAITEREGIKVITDLASLGYGCRWGIISAGDAGATHLRERFWLVAHTTGERRLSEFAASVNQEAGHAGSAISANGSSPRWYEHQSRLDRSPDGTSIRVDRHHGLIVNHEQPAPFGFPQFPTEAPYMAPKQKNTNKRLKALGNGAVPQIVYPIALYLKGMILNSSIAHRG